MKKVLVLFAHPSFENSVSNSILVEAVKGLEGVTFRDLYEIYPSFHIDVEIEKNIVEDHDVIILQHPFLWFSVPPLMKLWLDEVFEFNWAFGPKGIVLQGKSLINVITTGASYKEYTTKSSVGVSIRKYLKPFEQTAKVCKMQYLPPYVVLGASKLNREERTYKAFKYVKLINLLQGEIDIDVLNQYELMNDITELNFIDQ